MPGKTKVLFLRVIVVGSIRISGESQGSFSLIYELPTVCGEFRRFLRC